VAILKKQSDEARSLVVLIVDDDPDTVEMYSLGLAFQGFTVRAAAEAEGALADALANPPDCIVADMRMPRMSGLELRRRLAADPRCAALPVVAVTGLASDARESDSEFSAVLMKPCTPEALGQAIAIAIVQARGGERNPPLAAAKMLKRMARRRLAPPTAGASR